MSRICVKNLPKYVAEDRLREFFSKKGEITDAKLMRTKDGKSRQFAFIGFRTEQEAQEAIKYFNKSYLDTARIACEIARKVGDPEIPRPWSRHSLNKKDNAAETGKDTYGEVSTLGSVKPKGEGTSPEDHNDPLLQEFLQVMQPRAKSKLWANDSVVAPIGATSNGINAQKKQVGERSIPTDTETEKRNDLSKKIDSAANLPRAEVVSDVDYFKSRVKQDWSESEDSDDDDSDEEKQKKDNVLNRSSSDIDDKTVDSAQKHSKMKIDGLLDEADDKHPLIDTTEKTYSAIPSSSSENDKENMVSGRLFVRNLPYAATEEDLEELFSKFGKVSEVHVVVDKDTRRSKGIAYIQYQLPESSARALEELDNSSFQGRLLHVLPALQKSNPNKQEDSMNQSANTFKEKREEQRKASEASGDTRAWSTLYMRADTIVENIARKFGISKSDFLDREADDLAVRVALGEAQVIAETKKALSEAGVNVAALEEFAAGRNDAVKRSNHVLLVKNLPYGSSGAELTKMFGDYGSLEKVVLPPTKTMALVIFLEPSEARAAFKGLAYKRYKDAPLYLEWAPSNILNPAPTSGSTENGGAVIVEEDAKKVLLEQQLGLSEVDADSDKARTLYVKNVSFKTTDETLKSHFSGKMKEGKILSAKIKKHVKNGKLLSEGYGFVEFDSPETAANICGDLQGTVLDGHALILRPSQVKEQKQQLSNKRESDKSSTKLLIRNVAFEATEKDLRKLFGAFGKIKSLRLPNKFGNHRGFAFVEFVTKQEAQNAMKALFDTHLYGRHLVIERAKEGESLEELRARTAAQFTDEQTQNKLSRKRKHTTAIMDEGRVKFEEMDY